MNQAQTTKERLANGHRVLQTIFIRRVLDDDPLLGWGIEQSILNRELAELESEWRAHPAAPAPAGWAEPKGVKPSGKLPSSHLYDRRRGVDRRRS